MDCAVVLRVSFLGGLFFGRDMFDLLRMPFVEKPATTQRTKYFVHIIILREQNLG